MKRNSGGLSKNLLQMKFMQRTKENVEREKLEQDSYKSVDQEMLELCRNEGDKYMTTNSFLYCENLRFGRMSFKGMNPEIEKLMESKAPKKSSNNSQEEDVTETDVSNAEMAQSRKRMKPNKYIKRT